MNIKKQSLGHVLFITGVFVIFISFMIFTPINSSSYAFGASDVIGLSNQAREQYGKKTLKVNLQLMDAAQTKAEDMAKGRYFAHTAPDGTMAWDYLKKVSYSYDIAGENLAITNENANAVINGWLNSPSHRENLLSDDYQDFGIGMAFFGDYEGHKNTYVIVALYAKPAEKQVVTAPTSPAGTTTNFKPKLGDIPVAFIIAIAGLFMVIGSFIEIRHIKEISRSPTL